MRSRLSLIIDFACISRRLKKQLLVMLMISVICSGLAYLAVDFLIPQTYSIDVNFTVLSNTNSSSAYTQRLLQSCISRYVNMLGSEYMTEEMRKEMEVDELPGTIAVTSIYGSNIVVVKCTANSKRDVMNMARAIRRCHHNITDSMAGSYIIYTIGQDEYTNISTTSNMAYIIAALIFVMVFIMIMAVIILFVIFDGKIQNAKQAEEDIEAKMLGSILYEKKGRNTKSVLMTNNTTSFHCMESIQRTVISVMHEMERTDNKVLMLTSLQENEGKSTVSANLAIGMAIRGKKVLLIDFDFMKPSLFHFLKATEGNDLLDVMKGEVTLNEAIRKDEKTGLYYLLSNKIHANGDVVTEQGNLEGILSTLKETFDFILIDTPPAGLVRVSELLSEKVDSILIIAKTDAAPIYLINEMIDGFHSANANVLGFVLNQNYSIMPQTNYKDKYERYYSSEYSVNSMKE